MLFRRNNAINSLFYIAIRHRYYILILLKIIFLERALLIIKFIHILVGNLKFLKIWSILNKIFSHCNYIKTIDTFMSVGSVESVLLCSRSFDFLQAFKPLQLLYIKERRNFAMILRSLLIHCDCRRSSTLPFF